MPKTARSHDDLHLGWSVAVMIICGIITVILLPSNPGLAQTFLIAALAVFALLAAFYDYT